MLVRPLRMIVPILALAGSLAAQAARAASLGTFPTNTPLFVGLLVGTILIVGALTYFPALSLGPIVEHLLLNAGRPSEEADEPTTNQTSTDADPTVPERDADPTRGPGSADSRRTAETDEMKDLDGHPPGRRRRIFTGPAGARSHRPVVRRSSTRARSSRTR